jgi:hypothetical protein
MAQVFVTMYSLFLNFNSVTFQVRDEEEKNCLPSMYLKPYHLNAVFIISPFSVCIIMCLQSQTYLPWYLFSFASVIDPSVSLVSLFFLWLFCECTTTIHLSLEST